MNRGTGLKYQVPEMVATEGSTERRYVAQRESLSRSAVFDQNGVFTIKAIAPGLYKLYAFESVPEDVWLVPDFLKEIATSGVAIKTAEGDFTTIQLPLVGKTETDRILAKLGVRN